MDSGPNVCVGPPDVPDKYTLVRQVGGGGEAVLWLAELSVDGAVEPVAVKELRPDRLDDIARHSSRWAEQAELLRFVCHPGVVAVREHFQGAPRHRPGEAAGDDKRSLYLVMNWVEGRSLSSWVASDPERPGSAEALDHLQQVAEVLDLLHSGKATPSGRAIVHGDLSAENVMITPAGQAVLIDFGLVQLSNGTAHDAAGSPGYTAPEVWTSGIHSPSTDRYSFGSLSYFTLTGNNPPSSAAAMQDGLAAHPLLDGVSPAATDRLMSILSTDPDERPSATDWLRVLRNSAPTRSSPPDSAESTENWSPLPGGSDLAMVSVQTPAGARAGAAEQSLTGGEQPMTSPPVQEPATWRRRPKVLYAILAGVTALALIIAGVVIVPQLINKPTEVFAESANTVGANPFVTGIVPPAAPPVTPVSVPSNGTATPNVTGDTPGLYGGVQSSPRYDTTQLVSALQSDPVKAQVWTNSFNNPPATVHNPFGAAISPGIMTFLVAGLTAGFTRGLVRVTAVDYINGQAVPVQMILGPGTPVLMNPFGVPVIRITSATPLLAPIPIQGSPQVVTVGPGWPSWDPNNPMNGVYTISPAGLQITVFNFYDFVTGQLYTYTLGAPFSAQNNQLPPAPAAQPANPPPATVYVVPRRVAPRRVVPRRVAPQQHRAAPKQHRAAPQEQPDAPDPQEPAPVEQLPEQGSPPDPQPTSGFCGDGCHHDH